jgi:hypothetical protein
MEIIKKRLSKGAFPVKVKTLDTILVEMGMPPTSDLWAEQMACGNTPRGRMPWEKRVSALTDFCQGLGRTPTESEGLEAMRHKAFLAKWMGWDGPADNRCFPRGKSRVTRVARALLPPPSLWGGFEAALAVDICVEFGLPKQAKKLGILPVDMTDDGGLVWA